MKYTITEFRKEFSSDDVCLDYIFKAKYSKAGQYYRVNGRKSYANTKGEHIAPLAGTIFEKSKTPLTVWFEAIFLFSISKNGVSAKELQRHFGMTYKCAWRIGHQIRQLMDQDGDILTGTVEADETYYGKGGKNATKFKNKQAVLGVVERKGQIRVRKAPNRRVENVVPFIAKNVEPKSRVITDEYHGYLRLHGTYNHKRIKHGKGHWSWKGEHTNTIEGFWGQFKKSVRGTYAFVSPQYLQAYLDEFAFRYNHRFSPCFQILMARAAR